jgi:hypothetical protein
MSLRQSFVSGLFAIALPIAVNGSDAPATNGNIEPPPPSVASPTPALDELEARAPTGWTEQKRIEETTADIIALVGRNTLTSGAEFYRAAKLAAWDMRNYRTGRVRYELLLAAAAKDDRNAEGDLPTAWDSLMTQLGRPLRLDFDGLVTQNPDTFQLEAAPACIQAIWRNPTAARAALAAAKPNPEMQKIVDDDQAVRKQNWNNLTPDELKASTAKDHERNRQTREIVKAGELHTASDFANASLVMQHSQNFAGFQLAHELAVCSMLLGDRGLGRWLVTATYDRMLGSVGHDQRFGTQFGPTGLMLVDETGICDAERQALGCPTLSEARHRKMDGATK